MPYSRTYGNKRRAISRTQTKRRAPRARRTRMRPKRTLMNKQKYEAFNTTLAQRINRTKRENRKIEAANGATISRFLMMNVTQAYSMVNTEFNDAGYGVQMYWEGIPQRVQVDTLHTSSTWDTDYLKYRFASIVAFCPQLPTSKACFKTAGIGAANAYNQRFGLLPQYPAYANTPGQADNFNFSGVCFNQTYGFGENTELPTTVNDRGNRLRVFKSWVRIELENPNVSTAMKVHIVVCKLRAEHYNDGLDCNNEIQLNDLMKNDVRSLVGADDDSNTLPMRCYEDMRRGKLPNKIFKVIRKRQVYLGKKNTLVLSASAGPLYHTNIPEEKSAKTVTMAFGPKTLYRSYCSTAEDNNFSTGLMDEQWDKHMFCLMYCEPANFQTVLGTDLSTSQKSQFFVNYKIFKTNKWKVTNNQL